MKTLLSALVGVGLMGSAAFAQSPPNETAFFLFVANPTIVPCLTGNFSSLPSATVLVRRGQLSDTLLIHVTGLKPGLKFDLFTVQRSSLDATANPLPAAKFTGFGLAWYQTDLNADAKGTADALIQTILLDQIFGFDGDKRADGTTVLPPTNTFHVGFWFNNPADAANCGFDVTKPTPFNGEHKAGPLAMISIPDARTNLGPLCTSPTHISGSGPDTPSPQACNP